VRAWRGADRGRGQSLTEFALAIPIFMLVLVAIAEGGYFVVASTIVSHAAHEGARLGVLADTSQVALRNRVISSARAVVAIEPGDITVCINGASACGPSDFSGRDDGDRLHVQAAYTHRPLVGYVFPGISWQANAEAELWVEEDAK
jgi:hypothetical protein